MQSEWDSANQDGHAGLYDKICSTRKAISRWKRRNPTNNAILIAELKERLEKAQEDDLVSSEEELELKWKLCAA